MTISSIDINNMLVNIFSAAIAIEYMDHGFEKRYTGSRRIMLFIAGWLLYFIVVTGFNIHVQFEGVLGGAYGVVLLIYGLVALKGQIHEMAMISLSWILIAMISAYMMFGALGIMTGESLTLLLNSQEEYRIYSALATGTLKFAMGRVVLAIHKSRKFIAYTEDWIMGGTFFLMFVIVLGMFRLERGGVGQKERYYLSLYLLGGIFGLILLLETFYRRLDKYRQEKREAEYKKEMQEKQQEQIRDFYGICREINHFRHDMSGEFEVLYQLLKREKNIEVMRYIEQMEQNLKKYPELPQNTGNEGLNAALMKAIQECKKKGIEFRYVVMGKSDRIDSMDMGRLLYNLLSNGMEACVRVKKDRELELVVFCRDNEIEIQLENSIENSVMNKNPGLISWKEDKEKHGFGMQSILEIVEKYGGKYGYTEEDGRFIQSITLMQ